MLRLFKLKLVLIIIIIHIMLTLQAIIQIRLLVIIIISILVANLIFKVIILMEHSIYFVQVTIKSKLAFISLLCYVLKVNLLEEIHYEYCFKQHSSIYSNRQKKINSNQEYYQEAIVKIISIKELPKAIIIIIIIIKIINFNFYFLRYLTFFFLFFFFF